MLAPKSQETDATEILNNLLKEYDKKLRPDIGGNSYFEMFWRQRIRDINLSNLTSIRWEIHILSCVINNNNWYSLINVHHKRKLKLCY